MYKAVIYNRESGERLIPQFSNNIQYFDRYKGRTAYRMDIYKRVGRMYKLVYHEA